MMGPQQVEQDALFYNFSLDAHVPADHLLRSIDRFVELSELRRELNRRLGRWVGNKTKKVVADVSYVADNRFLGFIGKICIIIIQIIEEAEWFYLVAAFKRLSIEDKD